MMCPGRQTLSMWTGVHELEPSLCFEIVPVSDLYDEPYAGEEAHHALDGRFRVADALCHGFVGDSHVTARAAVCCGRPFPRRFEYRRHARDTQTASEGFHGGQCEGELDRVKPLRGAAHGHSGVCTVLGLQHESASSL